MPDGLPNRQSGATVRRWCYLIETSETGNRQFRGKVPLASRPVPWDQIHVGLTLSKALGPQFLPPEARYGDVLRRVVSLQLVLGLSVFRAQIKALEMEPVIRYAKRYTDNASQLRWRV